MSEPTDSPAGSNGLEPCTHPVPPNDFGIFAYHSRDNVPMSAEALTKIFNGPIANVQPALAEAHARIETVETEQFKSVTIGSGADQYDVMTDSTYPPEVIQKIMDGPIAAMRPKLDAELERRNQDPNEKY